MRRAVFIPPQRNTREAERRAGFSLPQRTPHEAERRAGFSPPQRKPHEAERRAGFSPPQRNTREAERRAGFSPPVNKWAISILSQWGYVLVGRAVAGFVHAAVWRRAEARPTPGIVAETVRAVILRRAEARPTVAGVSHHTSSTSNISDKNSGSIGRSFNVLMPSASCKTVGILWSPLI